MNGGRPLPSRPRSTIAPLSPQPTRLRRPVQPTPPRNQPLRPPLNPNAGAVSCLDNLRHLSPLSSSTSDLPSPLQPLSPSTMDSDSTPTPSLPPSNPHDRIPLRFSTTKPPAKPDPKICRPQSTAGRILPPRPLLAAGASIGVALPRFTLDSDQGPQIRPYSSSAPSTPVNAAPPLSTLFRRNPTPSNPQSNAGADRRRRDPLIPATTSPLHSQTAATSGCPPSSTVQSPTKVAPLSPLMSSSS